MAAVPAVEVIYKGWLKKAISTTDSGKKKSFLNRPNSNWKKQYFILERHRDGEEEDEEEEEFPFLCVYDKETTEDSQRPKTLLKLAPHYRVNKKHDPAGKHFIFEVRTPEHLFRLQSESETNMDLWVFYLQIQTKLRPDFPGYCFEVTPNESDPMRRIGAKGSKCLLHISKWGLTLALKRTRSLLAQWPLKCIRIFESSETGAFSFEAGRSAPMGEARYLFATNIGEDGRMYDLLDSFTTEMQQQRSNDATNPAQPATEEEVVQEYENLRLATFGLIPRRSSSVLSSGTPSASAAVPVPTNSRVLREGYDRLHRAQEGLVRHHSGGRYPPPVSKPQGIPLSHQQAPHPTPAIPSTGGPPLPPRQEGLKNPSSSFERSHSERITRSDKRAFESTMSEPYAVMTLPGTKGAQQQPPRRQSPQPQQPPTQSDVPQNFQAGVHLGSIVAPEQFKQFLNKPLSEYEKMAIRLGNNPYQNSGVSLLPNSYENMPLISPSPQDIIPGFPNMGFLGSPRSVDSGPPVLPHRSKQQFKKVSGPFGNQTESPIKHSYFQYKLNTNSPSSIYMHPSGAKPRPLSDFLGYYKVTDGIPGSHQYQDMNFTEPQQPQQQRASRILKRSMSIDDFFRNSTQLSIETSSAIESLDLAATHFQLLRVPSWISTRELPSLPPVGTCIPEINAYCGSPKSVFPPFTDFDMPQSNPPPCGEIVGSCNSFNNNNQEHTSDRVVLSSPINDKGKIVPPGTDEDGYLEPVAKKMHRSRSEADILDGLTETENVSSSGKKFHSRARSKVSKSIFATLRKRTKSTPDISKLGEITNARDLQEIKNKATKTAVASLMKRTQSNPDILSDIRPSPEQYTPHIATVKPASHSTSAQQVQRKKKFDFSLKLFRQSSKTSDKISEDRNSSGSDDESKSERRKHSLSETKTLPKTPTSDKLVMSPGVKGIVASEKTLSFVKIPSQVKRGQSPIGPAVVPKPTTSTKRSLAPKHGRSPSAPADIPSQHVHPSPSPYDVVSKQRLQGIINRPLPSPPQGNIEHRDIPGVKRYAPGMKQLSMKMPPEYKQTQPISVAVTPRRRKQNPPPTPPRSFARSIDSAHFSSSAGSNTSEYENTARKELSTSLGKSASFSERPRRVSMDNFSHQSSRTNSNASDYENTARLSTSLGKSASFSVSPKMNSLDNASIRSARSNSNASNYENTSLDSQSIVSGVSLPMVDESGCLSSRLSQTSLVEDFL